MPKRALDSASPDVEQDGVQVAGDDHDQLQLAGAEPAACAVPLPDELLSLVFSQLDIDDRARASRVCRLWRAAAVQSPHSTALTLRVLLFSDDDGDVTEKTDEEVDAEREARAVEVDAARKLPHILLPEEAAAVLRGPLCGGLRRLTLDLVLPLPCDLESTAPALGPVGPALPPTVRTLHVAGLKGWASYAWRLALGQLDLARTLPLLEDLEVGDEADLAELAFGHPSLRRLGASVFVPYNDRRASAALGGLPRLRTLRSLTCNENKAVAAFAEAGIRAESLHLIWLTLGAVHSRLLAPGSSLRLLACTLPADGGWCLPAGLAQLSLDQCDLTPPLLDLLLCRTATFAPGLQQLVLRNYLSRPRDVAAALVGVQGGTQIEVKWHWRQLEALAPLARALAASPTLLQYVHVDLCGVPKPRAPAEQAVLDDFAAYRRRRCGGWASTAGGCWPSRGTTTISVDRGTTVSRPPARTTAFKMFV